MKVFDSVPLVIEWRGGETKPILLKKQGQEKVLILIDGYVGLVDPETDSFNLRTYVPNRTSLIKEDNFEFVLKPISISSSGLTGIVHVYLNPDVEIEHVPFFRCDWIEQKHRFKKPSFTERVFMGEVPEYVVFYNRPCFRIHSIKPKKIGEFTYINGLGNLEEGSLYVTSNNYIPDVYFRMFNDKYEKIYAIKLSDLSSSESFWRVKMDNQILNVLASEDEIVSLVRERKISQLL